MSKKTKNHTKPETVKITTPQYDCNADKKKLTIWHWLLLVVVFTLFFAAF